MHGPEDPETIAFWKVILCKEFNISSINSYLLNARPYTHAWCYRMLDDEAIARDLLHMCKQNNW
jgi:hypothetical protein